MLTDLFANSFQLFLIVMVRLMGLFTTAPFFSGFGMPVRFKMAFTFFLAILSVPLVVGMGIKAPNNIVEFAVVLTSNFVFGLGIGFLVNLMINSFQTAAQVFSIPMGLGMSEVVDPLSQIQIPALGNFLGILILLLFFRADGHFYLIHLTVESFRAVNIIDIKTLTVLKDGIIKGLIVMFDISLKLALPIIAVTLLLDVAMGLISRVAPQFNVMIMGFNIKLIAGVIVLWLLLPSIVDLGGALITNILKSSQNFILLMKPGGI